MKTIEEINEIAPYHPCEWQEGYGIWQSGYMQGQKDGATEQKALDEAERLTQVNQAYLDGRREKEEDMRMMLESQKEKAIQYWDARLRELKQEVREGYDITRPKELIDFRKAMEE